MQSKVAFQTSAKRFSQALYPSDIKYNFANNLEDKDKYKVYVVYKISVKNNTTHNIPDLYKETSLHLISLTDTFDNYRYELNKDDIGDNVVKTEMEKWNIKENNIAEYKVTGSGKSFDTGLNKDQTESTYIQFKVTDKFLGDIGHLSQEEKDAIYENSPSVAGAMGYHKYTRFDKNWKDNNEYNHQTIDYEGKSASIGIIWKLADTRKISGVVFEDTKVNQLEGEVEKSRENERIGNGKLDINNDGTYKEKTISDVIVSLVDSETNQIAKAYNGDLTQGEDGKWRAVSSDAIVKVKDDGNYEIPDIVPGRYYLKFTYGNGDTEYTDINGNKIKIATKISGQNEPINSYLYKSTILSGAAKNANSENEKTWFLDSIKQGVYSVALDNDTEINKRINADNINTELNYDYTKNLSSSTIIANSPTMNIQFEYIPDSEIEANLINDPTKENPLKTNCTGMSFGIIERPYVNIELEKTIKNIQLTLQNGTNIINGDPNGSNISPYLASINKSNAKLELDPSYVYGSNAIVTYALSAHNRSELNYATKEYYKFGEIKDEDKDEKIVTTTVNKIADYLNNQNADYEKRSDNVINSTIALKDEDKNKYFTSDAIEGNKNYKQTVLQTNKILLPEAVDPNDLSKSSTDEYEFTVNNLLSTSDGILGWESYSEIIGISNITLTSQSKSQSGNFIVGDRSTLEADTANATISIYSSTGENKNMIIYYVVGGSLLIIALGVVLIRKFVIK